MTGLREGDRIAYAGLPAGSYAERRLLPADRAIRLPDAIGFDVAAAVLVRGLTAQMPFERLWPLRPGDTVLIQAAAGGVGVIATQWAERRGATVIGTVGRRPQGGGGEGAWRRPRLTWAPRDRSRRRGVRGDRRPRRRHGD